MTFTGFTTKVAAFYEELAEHNNRRFFTENRERYEELVRQPLEDLLGEAQKHYGSGKVMRPNRDVRFSKDKSPYKLSGAIMAGEVGTFYLSVSADGLEVGGGQYEPTRDQLERARSAIADQPRAAAELAEAKGGLEKAGFEFAGPGLKTAPRGYDKDHPNIELLRMKHYAALARLPMTASLDRILERWKLTESLNAWIDKRVGAPLEIPHR